MLKTLDLIEFPENVLHTQTSHRINGICSTKYFNGYFSNNNENRPNKADNFVSKTQNGKEIFKKANEATPSSHISSQDQIKQNKKDELKKVIFN